MKQFESETFDCVIDKGLDDSVLVKSGLFIVWCLFKAEFQENVEGNLKGTQE